MRSTYYSLADMFLFPSTYDTNGIVVREAAACGLASVLIKGSCAAEDTLDGQNAVLIDENSDALCAALLGIMHDRPAMRKLGDNAMEQLYISWEDAVGVAVDRYKSIIDLKKCGKLPRNGVRGDEFLKLVSNIDSFMRNALKRPVRDAEKGKHELEFLLEKELEDQRKKKRKDKTEK